MLRLPPRQRTRWKAAKDVTRAHFKGLSLHVIFMLIRMLYNLKREDHGAILARLPEIADKGALKPFVDEVAFGLEDGGAAYDRLAIGKVVIDVQGSGLLQ